MYTFLFNIFCWNVQKLKVFDKPWKKQPPETVDISQSQGVAFGTGSHKIGWAPGISRPHFLFPLDKMPPNTIILKTGENMRLFLYLKVGRESKFEQRQSLCSLLAWWTGLLIGRGAYKGIAGSRREMGRGWPSLHELPIRCAALRNPGHGSRTLSILNLNRKVKPSVRVGPKEGDQGQWPVKSCASNVNPLSES